MNFKKTDKEKTNIDKKNWYIVQTVSGKEKKVKTLLEERVLSSSLKDYFGDIVVPIEKVLEIKDGKKRRVDRCFFPGYVLINMSMSHECWELVKNTVNVFGFLGSDGPVAISEKEANEIISRVQQTDEMPSPKVSYEIGEVVRVIDGPFIDFDGIVEEVNYTKNVLKVLVVVLGRSTPVELGFDQITKI